jgi:hypothetical protein
VVEQIERLEGRLGRTAAADPENAVHFEIHPTVSSAVIL